MKKRNKIEMFYKCELYVLTAVGGEFWAEETHSLMEPRSWRMPNFLK